MRRTTDERPQAIYRARGGMLLGVCKGLARHFDMDVFWMRVIWVVAALCTGFWAVVAIYFLAGLLMKPEPALGFNTTGDEEFYNSYVENRALAVDRLKRLHDRLDKRIRRMEDIVTSKDFEWKARW